MSFYALRFCFFVEEFGFGYAFLLTLRISMPAFARLRGVCVYASGTRYEGLWLDGLRHGSGTLISPGGEAQTGQWYRDKLVGAEPAD